MFPLLAALSLLTLHESPQQQVILVKGAAGAEEFHAVFDEAVQNWRTAADSAQAQLTLIGEEGGGDEDKERLQSTLTEAAATKESPLWLVMIGHGTFDGKVAKFNLRGPDISSIELAESLQGCERPVVIVAGFSCSAPFLQELSGPNRATVTATRSGFQYNYSRFAGFFSTAIADLSSDLDKDQQVSLLEAFIAASGRVAEFYAKESRLATEHALLDDNGDALGTQADWYRGVRAVRAARDGAQPDGLRANQLCLIRSAAEEVLPAGARARRDDLEQELEALRSRKSQLAEAEYYRQLETVLVELAQIYQNHRVQN